MTRKNVILVMTKENPYFPITKIQLFFIPFPFPIRTYSVRIRIKFVFSILCKVFISSVLFVLAWALQSY